MFGKFQLPDLDPTYTLIYTYTCTYPLTLNISLTMKKQIRNPPRNPTQERRRQTLHQSPQDPTSRHPPTPTAQAPPHRTQATSGGSQQGRGERVCESVGEAGA